MTDPDWTSSGWTRAGAGSRGSRRVSVAPVETPWSATATVSFRPSPESTSTTPSMTSVAERSASSLKATRNSVPRTADTDTGVRTTKPPGRRRGVTWDSARPASTVMA
ncbi:hypothetical protein D3C85_802740 [compost metagenome]